MARDAVLKIGQGVPLDVPDDLLAVVGEGRGVAALVLKRRVAAVILTREDIAGVVDRPVFGALLLGLPRAAGATHGQLDETWCREHEAEQLLAHVLLVGHFGDIDESVLPAIVAVRGEGALNDVVPQLAKVVSP